MNCTKVLLDRLDGLGDGFSTCDIGLVVLDLDILFLSDLVESSFGLDNIKNGDVGAGFCESLGKAETETSCCAGKNGGLTLEGELETC